MRLLPLLPLLSSTACAPMDEVVGGGTATLLLYAADDPARVERTVTVDGLTDALGAQGQNLDVPALDCGAPGAWMWRSEGAPRKLLLCDDGVSFAVEFSYYAEPGASYTLDEALRDAHLQVRDDAGVVRTLTHSELARVTHGDATTAGRFEDAAPLWSSGSWGAVSVTWALDEATTAPVE